jgi:hypothetical protein
MRERAQVDVGWRPDISSADASTPSIERTPHQVKIAALLAHYVAVLPKPLTSEEEPDVPSRSSHAPTP